jgi:HTH-type transcriptional regulator, competence development regulator
MTGNKQFGDRIRQLRRQQNLSDATFSLRKFAQKVGISPTFLSKIECGEFNPPRPEKIIRMAELLDVDPDKLLALAGKVDPSLNDIIIRQPVAMAALLRAASGLSAEELKKIATKVQSQKESINIKKNISNYRKEFSQ